LDALFTGGHLYTFSYYPNILKNREMAEGKRDRFSFSLSFLEVISNISKNKTLIKETANYEKLSVKLGQVPEGQGVYNRNGQISECFGHPNWQRFGKTKRSLQKQSEWILPTLPRGNRQLHP
jgi:hypothetical protein